MNDNDRKNVQRTVTLGNKTRMRRRIKGDLVEKDSITDTDSSVHFVINLNESELVPYLSKGSKTNFAVNGRFYDGGASKQRNRRDEYNIQNEPEYNQMLLGLQTSQFEVTPIDMHKNFRGRIHNRGQHGYEYSSKNSLRKLNKRFSHSQHERNSKTNKYDTTYAPLQYGLRGFFRNSRHPSIYQTTHYNPSPASSSIVPVTTEGLRWINEPPSTVKFSNSTGGVIDCQAEGGTQRPEVKWTFSDGRPIIEVIINKL